jgi:hypothetical protein
MGGANELASMAACCVSFQLSFSKDQIAVADLPENLSLRISWLRSRK